LQTLYSPGSKSFQTETEARKEEARIKKQKAENILNGF
jgi:hypothetical protein